jgi:hypothetical protein
MFPPLGAQAGVRNQDATYLADGLKGFTKRKRKSNRESAYNTYLYFVCSFGYLAGYFWRGFE